MAVKNEWGLTGQQEVFAQEVAKGGTLADAYRSAYPRSSKWMQSALYSEASKLSTNTKVSQRIAALKASAAGESAVSAEKLVREIARLAFADPRRLVNDDGSVKGLHELDDDVAAAVSSVEVDEYGRVKYKLWDKGPAQERLAKYLGMYEKDNRQKGDPLSELAKAITGTVVGAKGIELGDDEDD